MDKKKIAEWTNKFLGHIRKQTIVHHVNEDEGYKFSAVQQFQTNFNIDATDIAGMLDASLEDNNLVVGAMYFPKKMLLIYANEFPGEVKEILQQLFDDSVEVGSRIDQAKLAFEELEQRRDTLDKKSYNTFIGLRFLSLLLGFYDPNKYNPLKPAEWRVFCRYINPEFSMPHHTSAGEQYNIYNNYIESLRKYLKARPEMIEIKDALTQGMMFKDDEYRWLTQDVIFVTARVYASENSNQVDYTKRTVDIDKSENEIITSEEINTGFMAYEQHLEEYIVKNWDQIDFGENLKMYTDEDGTTGQQYTTDVGIMDILATDTNGDYVVIELKRAESGYKVVGQVLNYMGWVQEQLLQDRQKVRGMIIVGRADKTLLAAVKPIEDKITLKEYQMHLTLSQTS